MSTYTYIAMGHQSEHYFDKETFSTVNEQISVFKFVWDCQILWHRQAAMLAQTTEFINCCEIITLLSVTVVNNVKSVESCVQTVGQHFVVFIK